jgi:hypothetical protein
MTKKKDKPVIRDPMTTIVETKREYTDGEKIEFGKHIVEAMGLINEKEVELKEFAKSIKDEITAQETIMNENAVKLRQGYEMTSIMCFVTYDDNKIAIFTNKDTGEVVERRELTEEEQLRLNSQWKDAEAVIREDNEVNG